MLLTETQAKYVEKFIELKSRRSVATLYGVTTKTVTKQIAEACAKCSNTAERVQSVNQERKSARKKAGNLPTSAQLLQLVEDQEYCCALTGDSIEEAKDASLDHINPKSNGGGDEIENLQWVLREINDMKGTLTQERFIELCCKVADYHRTPPTGPALGSSERL